MPINGFPPSHCPLVTGSVVGSIECLLTPEKVRHSNRRSIGHFADRWRFVVARRVTTPDLVRPCMVLYCSNFQVHDYPLFPYSGYSFHCTHASCMSKRVNNSWCGKTFPKSPHNLMRWGPLLSNFSSRNLPTA